MGQQTDKHYVEDGGNKESELGVVVGDIVNMVQPTAELYPVKLPTIYLNEVAGVPKLRKLLRPHQSVSPDSSKCPQLIRRRILLEKLTRYTRGMRTLGGET